MWMRFFILLPAVVSVAFCNAESHSSEAAGISVYMERDLQGSVRFTDRPWGENSELKWVSLPLMIEAKPTQGSSEAPQERHSIAIESPGPDEAIRANHGDLLVLTSFPKKQDAHYVSELFLNDVWVGESSDGSFELANLDRGTHRIRAALKDKHGNLLAKSPEVRFHLLKYLIPKENK